MPPQSQPDQLKSEMLANSQECLMKTQTVERPTSSVPFTLNFVEKIDTALYEQAIQDSQILKESYDPETQTSNLPVFAAGTALTYMNTHSGVLSNKDDTKQSDT